MQTKCNVFNTPVSIKTWALISSPVDTSLLVHISLDTIVKLLTLTIVVWLISAIASIKDQSQYSSALPPDLVQAMTLMAGDVSQSDSPSPVTIRPPQVPLDVEGYPAAPDGLELEQVHIYIRHGTLKISLIHLFRRSLPL